MKKSRIPSNRRVLLIASGTLVGVVVGLIAWTALGSSREERAAHEQRRLLEQAKESALAAWNVIPFQPVDGALIRSALEGLLVETVPVDSYRRGRLIDWLSDELEARGASDPSVYVRHVDVERCERWIAPSDPRWKGLEEWMAEQGVTGAQPSDALAETVSRTLRDGGRLVGISFSEGNACLRVMLVRSEDQLRTEVGRGCIELPATAPGVGFFRLRMPIRALGDIVEARESVVCALAQFLVKVERGDSFVFTMILTWDADCDGWAVHQITRQGWCGIRMAY